MSGFPSPTLLGMATSVVRRYDDWLRDQEDPPLMRRGIRHPGETALMLARSILAESKGTDGA